MENKIIWCVGFHHVALHSSDFEKSYKFYTEGLGFSEYRRWKTDDGRTIVLLDAGCGAMIELFSDGKKRTCFEEQAGLYVHLALRVKNSKLAFDRAVSSLFISLNIDSSYSSNIRLANSIFIFIFSFISITGSISLFNDDNSFTILSASSLLSQNVGEFI